MCSGGAVVVAALVIWTVHRSRSPAWIAVLLGAPAIALELLRVVTDSDDVLPYASGFEAVLFVYAAVGLIAALLRTATVTRDELFGIGAAFTLVAAALAAVYTVAQAVEPGSFAAATGAGERSETELVLLSVSTLSSVGLGDVVPVKAFARSLVMVEQLAGVAYLAMLVSRLVGLLVVRARDRGDSGSGDRPAASDSAS